MFRLNLLVKGSRSLAFHPSHRKFCTPKSLKEKLRQKFFIVDVAEQKKAPCEHKTEILDQKALKKYEIKEAKDDQWKRLFALINEIFQKYKLEAADKLREYKVQQTLIDYQKKIQPVLKEKLTSTVNAENVKQLVKVSQDQWNVIRASKGFTKALQFPVITLKLARDVTVKIQERWIIFKQSPEREKIEKYLIIAFEYGKRGAVEVLKFAKHVYNAPTPKSKH